MADDADRCGSRRFRPIFDAGEEVNYLHTECLGYQVQAGKGNIHACCFKRAHLRPMKARKVGALLGVAPAAGGPRVDT